MSRRLEDLQPPPAVCRILPEQFVTAICAATLIDRAKILRACIARVVDLQGVEKDFCLRGTRFLDTRLVAPDLQEIEI
jgi:hypothetical protein